MVQKGEMQQYCYDYYSSILLVLANLFYSTGRLHKVPGTWYCTRLQNCPTLIWVPPLCILWFLLCLLRVYMVKGPPLSERKVAMKNWPRNFYVRKFSFPGLIVNKEKVVFSGGLCHQCRILFHTPVLLFPTVTYIHHLLPVLHLLPLSCQEEWLWGGWEELIIHGMLLGFIAVVSSYLGEHTSRRSVFTYLPLSLIVAA
jgi:hypothetical protein